MPESSRTRSRRSAAAASLAGNAGTTLIASLQALLLVPLYLHVIGPKLYGAWLASGDVLLWLQSFDLGLPNLMIQRIAVAHGKGDERTAGEYFATGTAILAGISVLMVGLLMSVAHVLPIWLGLAGAEAHLLTGCIRLGAVASGLTLLNWGVVGYSRAVQDTATMNLVAVAAGIAGFCVTLVLLLRGSGLWALVLGSLVRAVLSLLGSGIFLLLRGRDGRFQRIGFSAPIAMEMLRLSPATAAGGIAYVLMNQSENAIVGLLLGPDKVPILSVTRKGADVLRSLLDMIGFTAYGGFAHLVGSADRCRASRVYREIVSLNLSLGVAAAATYMAVNPSFVVRWVGAEFFGGTWLTVLMATQMIVLSASYLVNYLYRASGRVMEGSVALIAECVVRIPLMAFLIGSLGLAGVPLAGLISSGLAGGLVHVWTVAELARFGERSQVRRGRVVISRTAILAAGAAACFSVNVPSWSFVLAAGGAGFAASAGLLVGVDPLLETSRSSLRGMLGRLRPSRVTKGN
jgi:O-antigen/teichoic acid export membrane protein